MALSALRGDITGRGSMLVDNDDAAIEALARVAIPVYLVENGIAYTETVEGWEVGPTTMTEAQLILRISESLLRSHDGEAREGNCEVLPEEGYPLITPWGP